MSEERDRMIAELHEARNRYERARYHLRSARTEEQGDEARAEFKAASIARTKARRAFLKGPTK